MPKPQIAPFDDVSGGALGAAFRSHPLLVAAPAVLGALAGFGYVILGGGSPRSVAVGLLGGAIVGALLALGVAWGRAADP